MTRNRPRTTRKRASAGSPGTVRRWRYADAPAKKTNPGAQKCVTHLVKNTGGGEIRGVILGRIALNDGPRAVAVLHGRDIERIGTRFDVSQRASGNQGHTFGTDLPDKDKDALVEYLKTL